MEDIIEFSPARSRRPVGTLSTATMLGLLIGALLPLVSAALYRTYSLTLSPAWFEITRQLGLPFALGEVAIVVHARRHGFELGAIVGAMERWPQRALALFLATFWISSIFVAQAAAFSTALALILVLHLQTMVAVFHLARVRRFVPGEFASGLALGLALLTGLTAAHLTFRPAGMDPAKWMFGAPIPGFISIRLFGAWAGAVLVVLLGVAWRAEAERVARPWLYPTIAVAAALIVWSGTRAAVLGIVVALVAAASLDLRGVARGFWAKALLAAAAGVALGYFLPFGISIAHGADVTSADAFTSGRTELWSKTLAVAVQRPLLGHGMGSNWWLVSLGGIYHVQPHNALVQFFMNWGLLPMLPALFLLGTLVVSVHVAAKRSSDTLPLVMAIDFLLTVSVLDGMMHFTRFMMLFAVLAGACLGQAGRAPEAGRTAEAA